MPIETTKKIQSEDLVSMDIEQQIDFELDKTHYSIIKVGAVANTLAGIFVIWILHKQTSLSLLISWYAILILINVCNIFWANHYENTKVTADDLRTWRLLMRFIVGFICLTWGSIGVIFYSANILYQFYIVTFLQVVVLAFAFSTVIDFVTTATSLSCLVLPTAMYRFYLAVHSDTSGGSNIVINIALGTSLVILGAFLITTGFIGYRLLRKSIKLSLENVALNKELENANRFLEQRVQERTQELENSLKLVTFQATHDLLTNLPNRRLLLEYLQTAMNDAVNNKTGFAVACFVINEIERINDAFGHRSGDIIIKLIARRFQNLFDETSQDNTSTKYTITLSRKDIFVILIYPAQATDIEQKAKALFKVVEEPIYIENNNIKLTASIGVSLFPQDAQSADSILMNSDAAMLYAKQRGGNELHIHQSDLSASLQKQIELESNLHQAVKKGTFLLQYQPIIDLRNKSIVCAEALVRWRSQSLGLIPPDEFIPLAEANGLIIPLGEWLTRKACEQLHSWHKLGYRHLKMAINLSAKQLHQKNLIQTILAIINETHLKTEDIELELTEREAFQEGTLSILKSIIDNGISLAIDDFGTGYSGLSNLKLLPISKIKIDKSFIKDVVTNADSQAIVSNTINLAKKINVTVLAEGVETEEQLNFLIQHQCDLVQGYYFSRPVDPDVFLQLLG